MQTDVAEIIFDIVKGLPEEQQKEVLKIAETFQRVQERDTSLAGLIGSVRSRGEAISDRVWTELPSDGAEHHDDYLYGSKEQE